jgi:hypothetical protein
VLGAGESEGVLIAKRIAMPSTGLGLGPEPMAAVDFGPWLGLGGRRFQSVLIVVMIAS